MILKIVFHLQVGKDSRKAAQGVQPLVRNEVTQNSPDIQVSGLSASQNAHTGVTPYRSAPLVPKGSFEIPQNHRFS